jgi:lipopolysaccharide export system permease protein
MSRLDRYVLRQVLLVSVFVAASLTAVAWLTQSMRLVDMVMNRGLSVSLFVWFTALLLPTFLALVLPVALFTAVAFVYNKLALDSELIVMQSAGLSRLGLARPALVASAMAALVCYSITIFFQPASYRAFKDLEFEIRNNYASILLQEGVFNEVSRGITVYVRKRGPGGELLGILVQDDRKPESPVTVMAERGAIVPGEHGPRVVMINGNRQERREGKELSQLFFERYDFDLGALGESPYARFRKPQERYLGELFLPVDRADEIPDYWRLRMEGHDRLAAPLLSFALPLVALALLLGAEFSRRGQVVRVLWAVGVLVALEAAMLGLKSLGARYPDTAGLIYLCPIATIAAAQLYLWRGPLRARRSIARPVAAAA